MKKRTLLISALSVFLLGLSACDLQVTPTTSSPAADSTSEASSESGGSTSSGEGQTSSGEATSSDGGDTSSSGSGDTSSQDGGSSSQPTTQYTITFDKNGGTGTMTAVTKNAGATYKLPDNGFTAPSGKQFKTWSIDNVEKAVGTDITVDKNLTVKAIWEDEPPVVSKYYLYKNADTTPIDLTWSESDNAWKGQVAAQRGDTFTVKKDANAYAITAEDALGNNVKVLNEKVTLLTGGSRNVDFYLHDDDNHTVWVSNYIQNEYILTVGDNDPVVLEHNTELGKENEYFTTELNVKAGDEISVIHDQEEFTYTRKDGDNNINALDLTINNDANPASVYLDVVTAGHPIWVSGYTPVVVNYSYYYELTHNAVTGDKTALVQSSESDIQTSGADDQYEYTFTSGVTGGDFIKFYYSTDSGSTYHPFGDVITIQNDPAQQNLNDTAEAGKFVVIADSDVSQTLYLKITGTHYSLLLGGYEKVIIFTVGETPVALADGAEYTGSIASAGVDDAWNLEVDRKVVPLTAKPDDGDNKNNVVTVAGVTKVIRPITTATNVYITPEGLVWCEGFYDLYDVYVGETKVADDIKTNQGIKVTADAGSFIRVKKNGSEEFQQISVKTPGDNNVKATDDNTKLLVIKSVVAGAEDNLYINPGDAIWLYGYGLQYNVQIGDNHYLMTPSDDSERGTDTWDEQYKLLGQSLTAGQTIIFNKDYNTPVAISAGGGNLARSNEGVITAKITYSSDIYLKRYGENWSVWASCDDAYYLRGGFNGWDSLEAYRFTKGTKTNLDDGNGVDAKVDGKDQYFINDLVIAGTGEQLEFKAFSIDTYYPSSDGNLAFPSAGTYDVYFVPAGDVDGTGLDGWKDFDSRGYFYINRHPEPQSLAVVVSGSVTQGQCLNGANIAITLTYDNADEEPVEANNPAVTYILNGGGQISYTTLTTTPLNENAQLIAKYAGLTSAVANITVVAYTNNYSTVAIKNEAGTADYTADALFVGDTAQATAYTEKTDPEEDATDSLVWSSSDNDVATVSQSGLITAIAPGTATITLAAASNPSVVKDTCEITVSEHTYYQAKVNNAGDFISFDPIENSDSWVSHTPINFSAGNTLTIYYDGVAKTFTAGTSEDDHNNLHATNGIITAGSCYVYLNDLTGEHTGTIWVKGYARITFNGVSYAAEHRFDDQEKTKESYYITVNAQHGQTVTAGVIGGSGKSLTLDTDVNNNLRVVSTALTILTSGENTDIYMHDYDSYSVWASNYVADYKIKIGTNDPVAFDYYDSGDKQYVYTGEIPTSTAIAIYDNGYDMGYTYDTNDGNNLNSNMTVKTAGVVKVYAKINAKNVWVSNPTYALYVNDALVLVSNEVPTGWEAKAVFMAELPASASVKVKIGSTTYTYSSAIESAGIYEIGLNNSNQVWANKLPTYYLAGNMNDWNESNEYKLTKSGDRCFSIELDAADHTQFKVKGNTTWYAESSTDGAAANFTINDGGHYVIKFYPWKDSGSHYIVCE